MSKQANTVREHIESAWRILEDNFARSVVTPDHVIAVAHMIREEQQRLRREALRMQMAGVTRTEQVETT